MESVKQKTCLIVIDGWGVASYSDSADTTGDAIINASTPVMDELCLKYPNVKLSAHGLSVGLPEGLMGNSEVGHLNIGAGRTVYQDIVRIELSIKNDLLKIQPAIQKAFQAALLTGKLHLCGLVSDGGVHGHIDHLKYLLLSAKNAGIKKTYVHFIADGRDTAPKSAIGYMSSLLEFIKSIEYGNIATVVGRYYAMDRDKRWERVKISYDAMIDGMGEYSDDPLATINERYQTGETDEFLRPIIVNKDGCLRDNDTVIMFNFRSDRMREINQALYTTPTPFESRAINGLVCSTN